MDKAISRSSKGKREPEEDVRVMRCEKNNNLLLLALKMVGEAPSQESRQLLADGKGKKTDAPPKPPERNAALLTT